MDIQGRPDNVMPYNCMAANNHIIMKLLNDYHALEKFASTNSLCSIKQVSYADGVQPDYMEISQQLFYNLKYYAAYIIEYIHIYSQVLQHEHFKTRSPKVVSFGCGNLADFYGLKFAQQLIKCRPFSYVGVDQFTWETGIKPIPDENYEMNFVKRNINELTQIDIGLTNVIMFPKSMGEFNKEHFELLLESMKDSSVGKKMIYFVSALTTNLDKQEEIRFRKLIKHVSEKFHYRFSPADCEVVWFNSTYSLDDDAYLENILSGFEFNDISRKISEIHEKCCRRNDCSNRCVESKWPIKKTKYIHYQIAKLER